MSELANGWSWYKFDIEGWLTSPDVQQMNMAERGMYHHMITIQARDGKLTVGMRELAKQIGQDKRTVENWMKKWGYLFPIIAIDADVILTSTLRPCNEHVTSAQPGCNACVAPTLPLRCFPAASWMRTRSFRVNPKQWNFSVKSGKWTGQPLLEEKREELDLEGDERGEKHMSLYTLKPKTKPLLVRGEGA